MDTKNTAHSSSLQFLLFIILLFLSHSHTLSTPFQFYLPLGSRVLKHTQLGCKYCSVSYFHLLFYPRVWQADGDRRQMPQTAISVAYSRVEAAHSVLMCSRHLSVNMTVRTVTGLFQLWHQLLQLVRTGRHISECYTQLPLLLLQAQSQGARSAVEVLMAYITQHSKSLSWVTEGSWGRRIILLSLQLLVLAPTYRYL